MNNQFYTKSFLNINTNVSIYLIVIECANDLEKLSVEFKKKFPKKISKTGEDMRIAEVIMNRLAECQKKVKRGHWEEVDEVLILNTFCYFSKILECQNALVEEHIACTNLLSFACQFAKPEFQFRLLPAKLIISEARSAKTAAEVCRAITKEAKQREGKVTN
uniref:Uncharacterized protein n=1 Tax=Syphacia muris TaxID=451379 RepID=A0A0N5AUN4_9BILA